MCHVCERNTRFLTLRDTNARLLSVRSDRRKRRPDVLLWVRLLARRTALPKVVSVKGDSGLTGFSRAVADRCFADNPPGSGGRTIADYWLSLWRGDELPRRADFKPRGVAEQLPLISIFDVVPDKSVHCRLHGSVLAQALGEDLTGKDWIAMTAEEDKPVRLQRWSDVARGAIGRGVRAGRRESGEPQYSEEIMLPFGDVTPDGSRQVLYHLSWRQTMYDPTVVDAPTIRSLAIEFRLTDLRAA